MNQPFQHQTSIKDRQVWPQPIIFAEAGPKPPTGAKGRGPTDLRYLVLHRGPNRQQRRQLVSELARGLR